MTESLVQAVLDSIDEREIVELASELVRRPSVNPPGDERDAAEALCRFLTEAGIEARLTDVHPGRPNVIAEWTAGQGGPTMLLNGHLDVVPPGDGWTVDPFAGVIREGRLYGRGACDMKGPIAAAVGALTAVRRAGVPLAGSVVLTAVAGEEVDQCGTRRLVDDGVEADFAICAEPTRLVPVIAHKGEVYVDVTINGRAAHGSVPDRGVNAIVKAARVVTEVTRMGERLKANTHPLCGHPTINVGTIQGGTITSTVPDRCVISMDRRLLPGETCDQARADIERVLESIAESDSEFDYRVDCPLVCPPMEISPDEPIVASLRRHTATLTGRDPGVQGWNAACDATLLVNHAGIPTCIFGPGDLDGQAHKPDEHVRLDELVLAAKIYALTILDLLGGQEIVNGKMKIEK